MYTTDHGLQLLLIWLSDITDTFRHLLQGGLMNDLLQVGTTELAQFLGAGMRDWVFLFDGYLMESVDQQPLIT